MLPPPIYSSASHMNYHVFNKVQNQAILLAFPGMIASLFLTGILCRFTLAEFGGYAWNWEVCFLFGAIVSATDPVAVVAALEELGAPEKLSSVIDGESLLNDGSAMVAFNIFLELAKGKERGATVSRTRTEQFMCFTCVLCAIIVSQEQPIMLIE